MLARQAKWNLFLLVDCRVALEEHLVPPTVAEIVLVDQAMTLQGWQGRAAGLGVRVSPGAVATKHSRPLVC